MRVGKNHLVNEHIVRQPVVFFLGAGSSVPLGMPTTLGFRKVLIQKSSKEEKPLINALYSSAAYRYGLSEDGIDLERFLEFLHEIRLALWILSRANLSKLVSSPLAEIDLDSWKEADLKVNSVRWRVLEALHEVCGDCQGQKASELWEPVLTELRGFTTVFPIFTLNYDWAFEKLCIAREDRFQLTDGFSSALGGNWSSERFSKFVPSRDRMDICLFKLHGSTCWVGDIRSLIKSLGPFTNPESKPKYGFEGGDSRPFDIMYPGYRREVWLGEESWSMPGLEGDLFVNWREQEPYSLLYRYLDESLTNARVVIVIGYAFRDEDINARFARTLSENKEIHVVVLDPGLRWERKLPGNLEEVWYDPPYEWSLHLMDLGRESWSNRLHWTRGRFGTKSSVKHLLAKVKTILSKT